MNNNYHSQVFQQLAALGKDVEGVVKDHLVETIVQPPRSVWIFDDGSLALCHDGDKEHEMQVMAFAGPLEFKGAGK